MTRSGKASVSMAAVVVMVFAITAAVPPLPPPAYSLPSNAQTTCVVTPGVFATWFHSGTPALNGLVDPANSVTFPNTPNCSFYQWSEQMFLWLTSPTGGGHVFSTNEFFQVSPPDPITGNRTFIPQPSPGTLDVEQSEADTNVLEAQATSGGSLVYYITFVNDVYAYFLTGIKNGALSATETEFPTTSGAVNPNDLSHITAFASSHGVTFGDPNALAVMVKSAWVEASTLADPSDYITTTATIPTYNTSNPNSWTTTGTQTVQLALVGMHVVGSAAGHPEMIWATYEHYKNAPNADYKYVNTSAATVDVPQNTNETWLFTATNSAGPFDQSHMDYSGPTSTINSVGVFTISPSDTLRWKAFGGASNGTPNPLDATTAASNSEIISINNSVMGMLNSGDLRTNYILTGASWTIGGAAPTGIFQSSGNIVGTSVMSNTTMETYVQGSDTTSSGVTTCLNCHGTLQAKFLSHDWGNLQPLTQFTPESTYSLSAIAANLFFPSPTGGPVVSHITINPLNGFKKPVTLSAKNLPKGITATFDPNPTFTSTTMTLTGSSTETPVAGVTTVEILGMPGGVKSSTTVSLTVNEPNFVLGALPNLVTLNPGGKVQGTVNVYSNQGFAGEVKLSASGIKGVTASFSPNPVQVGSTGSSSVLTLKASTTATIGTASTMKIKGTAAESSGTLTGLAALTVSSLQPQDIVFTTNAPASAANGSNFTVAANATSGLPVVFTSLEGCTNSGATFTMTSSTGGCAVIANQPGNSSFSPAPQVTQITTANPGQTTKIDVTSVSPSSEAYGQTSPVTITAVLAWTGSGPAPTASDVAIFGNGPGSYGKTSCSPPSGDTMTCTNTYTPTATDPTGFYTESALFSGDANYGGSNSPEYNNFTITPAGGDVKHVRQPAASRSH